MLISDEKLTETKFQNNQNSTFEILKKFDRAKHNKTLK